MAPILLLLAFFIPSLVLGIDPLVNLGYTSYKGTERGNGITDWLGMRYAAPPLGKLRFSAPQDPLRNSSVQSADEVFLLLRAQRLEHLTVSKYSMDSSVLGPDRLQILPHSPKIVYT